MRLAIFAICLFIGFSAKAMELGQTRDAIVAQHGRATEENHTRNTATYRRAGWKVDLEYRDNVACKITFSRLGQLSETEIASILAQNAGGMEWREQDGNASKRTWQRADFAIAECGRVRPASMTFAQAAPRAEEPAQQALVEATPLPGDNPPNVYALEPKTGLAPSSPPAAPGPLVPALNILGRYPLVFAIPAVLLFIGLLFGRKGKRPAAEITPARRVVTPRAINDAMAVAQPGNAADLDPADFELLVGEIFRRKGYEVEISGGIGTDGGSDLSLRKNEEGLVLVQCRQWGNWKVSAPPLQGFIETLSQSDATRGIFVTTGDYTEEARLLVGEKPVTLIGGGELHQLISEVAKPGEDMCVVRSWLDSFASNVTVMEPTCPFCQDRMTLKRGLQGRAFWSCRTFPQCAGKRDGRVDLLQKLPGFAAI